VREPPEGAEEEGAVQARQQELLAEFPCLPLLRPLLATFGGQHETAGIRLTLIPSSSPEAHLSSAKQKRPGAGPGLWNLQFRGGKGSEGEESPGN